MARILKGSRSFTCTPRVVMAIEVRLDVGCDKTRVWVPHWTAEVRQRCAETRMPSRAHRLQRHSASDPPQWENPKGKELLPPGFRAWLKWCYKL